MIVKLIIREEEKDLSIWNKEGDRLFYSDLEEDFKFSTALTQGQSSTYWQACWRNKKVFLNKRVTGYNW